MKVSTFFFIINESKLSISFEMKYKSFHVIIHTLKTSTIKEVIWHISKDYWSKCNTHGVASSCFVSTGCGCIFRDNSIVYLNCFDVNWGLQLCCMLSLWLLYIVAIETTFELTTLFIDWIWFSIDKSGFQFWMYLWLIYVYV